VEKTPGNMRLEEIHFQNSGAAFLENNRSAGKSDNVSNSFAAGQVLFVLAHHDEGGPILDNFRFLFRNSKIGLTYLGGLLI